MLKTQLERLRALMERVLSYKVKPLESTVLYGVVVCGDDKVAFRSFLEFKSTYQYITWTLSAFNSHVPQQSFNIVRFTLGSALIVCPTFFLSLHK